MRVLFIQLLYICILQEESALGLDYWQVSTDRAFTIINDLLVEVGSDERVYQLYEGNDCHAIFLTAELYEAIITSKALPPDLLPRPVRVDRGPDRDDTKMD